MSLMINSNLKNALQNWSKSTETENWRQKEENYDDASEIISSFLENIEEIEFLIKSNQHPYLERTVIDIKLEVSNYIFERPSFNEEALLFKLKVTLDYIAHLQEDLW